MHRTRRLLEKPKINMTPMIDVVFLLLTFFVLTFKIIIPEGDFNVRMSPAEQGRFVEIDADSVLVRLLADADGQLAAIQLDHQDIESFEHLRQQVSALLMAKPDLEVALFPDEQLHYGYFIQAITAINYENVKFVREHLKE